MWLDDVKWNDIYAKWKYENFNYSGKLSAPMSVEEIFVEYNREGYIYGYDWLENEDVQPRKNLIKRSPIEFLYFTEKSNKGTIRTAEMLVEAENEEEIAAIWIAATAKELCEYKGDIKIGRYASALYYGTSGFLRERYYLWHHAMRRLVPEIMISRTVLNNMVFKDVESVIGIIAMNTLLLKDNWTIVRYTSLKNNDILVRGCRI